jgi:hypothetical protein
MTVRKKKKKLKKPKEKPSLAYRIVYITSALVSVGGFIAAMGAFELPHWSNNLDYKMHFYAIVVGMLVCVGIYYLMAKTIQKFWVYEGDKKWQVLGCLIVTALTLFPAAASMINYSMTGTVVSCNYYVIREIDSSHRFRKISDYWIVVERFEKVEIAGWQWEQLNIDDSVKLCVVTGGLGFNYINTEQLQ